MRIYTKFGDRGNTSLVGGAVVAKTNPRIDAGGHVDELNAILGVILSSSPSPPVSASLSKIQKDLFSIGAELAGSRTKSVSLIRISELEAEIDSMEEELPKIHNFILPNGSTTASMLHLARTVCRRAERQIVYLSQKENIDPDILVYINRVSDLLFVHARYDNYKKKIPETIWKGR